MPFLQGVTAGQALLHSQEEASLPQLLGQGTLTGTPARARRPVGSAPAGTTLCFIDPTMHRVCLLTISRSLKARKSSAPTDELCTIHFPSRFPGLHSSRSRRMLLNSAPGICSTPVLLYPSSRHGWLTC